MGTAKSVTTGTICSAETGNGHIGKEVLTMSNNANCITCRHKKDFLVPCDWLKNQRAVIMPPCPRYESEEEDTDARIKLKAITLPNLKPCYGKCNLCIWKYNGGCSEWNGWGTN